MGSTFNPHILVDKLSKLNSSQQSIETLSHWCIFHMNKSKQVVETWDRQFHCCPGEQRLAFLYLANDILQNSRRKGIEFVTEFWKVLPNALHNVTENGDESGRNAALRLINIWDERKVFGSRGQVLKEEFLKRQSDNGNRMHVGFKLQKPPPNGNTVDKLILGYQAVYGSQLDEVAIFNKCRSAISFVEKVDKNIETNHRPGGHVTDEVKGQKTILRECIEQLTVIESCRTNLVALLHEALQEQECKLNHVRDQLQAAQTHSEQADSILFRQLLLSGGGNNANEQQAAAVATELPPAIGMQQSTSSVVYTPRQVAASSSSITEKSSSSQIEEEDPTNNKPASVTAAAVAAKLAASTSSAQMLTSVLSTLASSGIMTTSPIHPSATAKDDFPSEKRIKIENGHLYVPSPHNTQSPPTIMSHELDPDEPPPPPPSSPPPQPPPLPPSIMQQPYEQVPQYMQFAMSSSYGLYNNNMMMIQPSQQVGGHVVFPPNYRPPMNGGVISATTTLASLPNPNVVYQSYPTIGGGGSTVSHHHCCP